jgi:hypothetical protein
MRACRSNSSLSALFLKLVRAMTSNVHLRHGNLRAIRNLKAVFRLLAG